MYEVEVIETGRNCLRDEPSIFNNVHERFNSLEDVKEFFIEKYGKMPKGRNKVYVDNTDGSSQEIGFVHSFWNKDWSHNSKSWFQTDWVCVNKLTLEPVLMGG